MEALDSRDDTPVPQSVVTCAQGGESGADMEGFDALVQMYREALPEKRAALEQEWRAIVVGAPPEAAAQALRRQLHQLSGSAGAYGYEAMGEMAREMEKRWVQWLALVPDARPDARQVCADWRPLMQALCDALQAASLPADA
jgi:HPt (histidine-containing phosphotransfer) domain-containing protein